MLLIWGSAANLAAHKQRQDQLDKIVSVYVTRTTVYGCQKHSIMGGVLRMSNNVHAVRGACMLLNRAHHGWSAEVAGHCRRFGAGFGSTCAFWRGPARAPVTMSENLACCSMLICAGVLAQGGFNICLRYTAIVPEFAAEDRSKHMLMAS